MDPTKYAEIGPSPRTSPFAGGAMHFAFAIPIVIARPFTGAMTDGHMLGMTAMIVLPFVWVEDRAAWRYALRHKCMAGALIGVRAHPEAMFPTLARRY